MRRILFSLMIIGVMSVLVIGGTMAFFRDVEKSEDNTFTAGTIDIAVDGENPWAQSFDWEDVKPGKNFEISYNVTNVGENPLKLWQIIKCPDYDENGVIEPEQEWYDKYNSGLPKNDIDSAIVFEMYVDNNMVIDRQAGITLDRVENRYIGLKKLDPGANSDWDGILEPGESVLVKQWFEMLPDTENWAQSDKLGFVLEIEARQISAPEPLAQMNMLENKSGSAIVDNRMGLLKYETQAPAFNYNFYATGLIDGDYQLIYYPDPWVFNKQVVLIGGVLTAIDGKIETGDQSVVLGHDMPMPSDDNFDIGAKVWLVPAGQLSGNTMTWGNSGNILFENWPGWIKYHEGIRPNEEINCENEENNVPVVGCGDGVLDFPTEGCDNGTANIDGQAPIWALTETEAFRQYCSTDCEIYAVPGKWCGDGNLDNPYEACDDGNNVDGDGCEADCTFTPSPDCTDADGDGYGVGPDRSACTYTEEDCNDSETSVNPGATEICDGIDNDCDGDVDEEVLETYYYDSDSDGFGEDGTTVDGCSLVSGYAVVGGDCNDGDADINPNADEICDGADNNCDGQTDENWTELGSSCSVGDGACAASGNYICNVGNPAGLAVCDAVPGTPTTEVCDDGIDNDCDTLVDCLDEDCAGQGACVGGPDINPGDLVIDEIMQNPSAVDDTAGEWFEIYNPTAGDIDIQGCQISDDGTDAHIISSSLDIPAGAYAVLARNNDSNVNGGVAVDYQYSGFTLGNANDEIVLICNGTEIDRVAYDGGPDFPNPSGASMMLSDHTLDNNVGANWCTSLSLFGAGDQGTPGAANDVCGASVVSFDQQLYTAGPGEQLRLTINVDQADDLFGIGFDLSFDSDILQFVSADGMTSFLNGAPSCMFMPVGFLKPGSSDTISLAGARMGTGCSGVSGSGELVTLVFNTKTQSGISPLNFSNTLLQNLVSGNPPTTIPGVWHDSEVVVEKQKTADFSNLGATGQFGFDYNYGLATASFSYTTPTTVDLNGTFTATGLKPFATYQLKFEGKPLCNGGNDDDLNERIGYLGRWWDLTADANVSDGDYETDSVVNGGTHCIVGYIVWDHVTADAFGNVTKAVAVDNSYHVLWCGGGTCDVNNNDQLQNLDGTTLPGFPYCAAGDVNGQIERFGCDGLDMPDGNYDLRLVLNEESFHQNSFGEWTAVMDSDIDFIVY